MGLLHHIAGLLSIKKTQVYPNYVESTVVYNIYIKKKNRDKGWLEESAKTTMESFWGPQGTGGKMG